MHEISKVMNWIDVLVWFGHVKRMRWLVMKVAWSWYEIWFYINGWNMVLVCL